ncbi:hypothetical protein JAAARDRAFT_193216 [Jaapia argillacea MUCL 33604]|uniref:RNI-like protein n=1 Tax=Jaapia argillacea MUCL 33604 TaxID=933084 RepID=A0A067Q5B6_9AGAM|nr:hypothetical protein JAAARDRAFT_193216 [Jaapia argillacea MUCL 33604]
MFAPQASGLVKKPSRHRGSPSSGASADRGLVFKVDAGLCSVIGAREIIKTINSHQHVTRLILGHNQLGDEGCIELFTFLSSPEGHKHRIEEISLNSNKIENRGLEAIIEFLRGNLDLKELFLQNNEFTCSPTLSQSFAEALNTSRLSTLTLTTNRQLSDAFVSHFLPYLHTPHLKELHLSVIALTPSSAPHLIAYISSPRCRVTTLKCNGNALGLRSVQDIVTAIDKYNYTLCKVELYSNQLSDVHPNAHDEEDSNPALWGECGKLLVRILYRNEDLKSSTESGALALLVVSRTLLLKSSSSTNPNPKDVMEKVTNSCPLPTPMSSPVIPPIARTTTVTGAFAFSRLPIELQLTILGLTAPVLSTAQQLRIFAYASDLLTLPHLSTSNLNLPTSRPPLPSASSTPSSKSESCSQRNCVGHTSGVKCRNEMLRKQWLESMGCDVFEFECRDTI